MLRVTKTNKQNHILSYQKELLLSRDAKQFLARQKTINPNQSHFGFTKASLPLASHILMLFYAFSCRNPGEKEVL